MTDKVNKLQQVYQNDVEIVLRLQNFILDKNEFKHFSPDQIHALFKTYGELYHPYAVDIFERLTDLNV